MDENNSIDQEEKQLKPKSEWNTTSGKIGTLILTLLLNLGTMTIGVIIINSLFPVDPNQGTYLSGVGTLLFMIIAIIGIPFILLFLFYFVRGFMNRKWLLGTQIAVCILSFCLFLLVLAFLSQYS